MEEEASHGARIAPPRAYAVLDAGGTLTFCRSLDACESGRQGRLTDLGGAVRAGTVYAVPLSADSGVSWDGARLRQGRGLRGRAGGGPGVDRPLVR